MGADSQEHASVAEESQRHANQQGVGDSGCPPSAPAGDMMGADSHSLGQLQYEHNPHAFASQIPMTPQSNANSRGGAFNMANMANTLPQGGNFKPMPYVSGAQPSQQQRFSPSTASPPMMPPMAGHYGPQSSIPVAGQHYYMSPQHSQPFYGQAMSPAQQHGRPPHPNYYPNQMGMGMGMGQVPPGYYYPPPAAGFHQGGMPSQMIMGHMFGSNNGDGGPGHGHPSMATQQQGLPLQEYSAGKSGVVRGPPRKPRQSGHAIWIGNLPPQTELMSLVHHVCQETSGLESLFLISKSNCAFANFKDETACTGAQQKLHDSKFQTVRLVSRLRKNTVECSNGVTAPTGPAAASEPLGPPDDTSNSKTPTAAELASNSETESFSGQDSRRPSETGTSTLRDKFFILKSLTGEDLELSVQTGIWATQSHNEQALNGAFATVDNVYLVFSANKSGEYFGYARMLSPINNDPEAAIEFAPKAQATNDVDLPKAIPTEATEYAPRGRIIDDSARGTIFWEAEREEGDEADEAESETSSAKGAEQEEGATKTWGKPFKLEWLSTARLPFYRTRGLRNPWNSNREVKIARDGTELEPLVGRKLIGLFNRVQSPAAGPMPGGMRPGMPMMPTGYLHMRSPY